ncbi:MAG: low molecular weight protein arginine phosphatase [Gemmatimonadaceae bacterium]
MHILFVCTGNTCRSPLAESIARQMVLDRQLSGIEVKSAGTHAASNSPASDGSLLVALEQGLDVSTHRAQQLTPELVQWADVILTMGSSHLAETSALGGQGKSYLLTDFSSRGQDNRNISDPFGSDLPVYRETFVELVHEIGNAFDRLVSEHQHRSV